MFFVLFFCELVKLDVCLSLDSARIKNLRKWPCMSSLFGNMIPGNQSDRGEERGPIQGHHYGWLVALSCGIIWEAAWNPSWKQKKQHLPTDLQALLVNISPPTSGLHIPGWVPKASNAVVPTKKLPTCGCKMCAALAWCKAVPPGNWLEPAQEFCLRLV